MLDQNTLTPKALAKLRVYSTMALISFPVFCLLKLNDLLDGFSKPFHLSVTILLLSSSIPLWGSGIYNRFYSEKRNLDEREREAIRNARLFSYRACLGLFLLLVIIAIAYFGLSGHNSQTPYFSIAGIVLCTMSLAFITMFLPIAHIAWTQKPLPLDE